MTAPYYQDDLVTLYHGDCIEMMRALPDESLHAVVTDPPYGIRFMGQAWDGADIENIVARGREKNPMPEGVGGPRGGYRSAAAEAGRYNQSGSANRAFQEWCKSWAAEAWRVLKPGGHLLASGSSRTWHRLTAGIEDAGFEIRDSIAWLYGSGFPKSRNLDGEWEGWGTALKPAFEPIVVARKPLAGTVAGNVLAHGVGALNIGASRIPTSERLTGPTSPNDMRGGRYAQGHVAATDLSEYEQNAGGRWPTNVTLDESQAAALDQQSGILTSGLMKARTNRAPRKGGVIYGADQRTITAGDTYADTGGASRFFPTFRYEAKAPTSERPEVDGVQHPTVKPLDLMRWLVKLVTPPGGTVLEPFAGSGTTVEACLREGFSCIAIEREDTYLPLIMQRIKKDHEQSLFGDDWDGAA